MLHSSGKTNSFYSCYSYFDQKNFADKLISDTILVLLR